MPELPEVETVKNSLKELIINKTISKVTINYTRIIQNCETFEFENNLVNQTFVDVKRIGKYLILQLNDYSIVSHLRMEGKYFLKQSCDEISKHDHVIFHFTDGTELRYNDTRKFGTMHLYQTTDIEIIKTFDPLSKLGLEPFDPAFTKEYLKEKFKSKTLPIKTVLLDQTIISGLGNIYADEVCFMMKTNPYKKAKELTDEEIEALIKASKEVLTKAIRLGGTTIKSFISAHEASGLFQNHLLVHTKENCPECNAPITKKFINGRGTYFCPRCQKSHLRPLVVIITGGIATGKSYVAKKIRELGYLVIDSDILSKEALNEGTAVYNKVIKHYKEKIITEGKLDRSKLAQIVFTNPKEKEYLEHAIHPFVVQRIDEIVANTNDKLVFVEMPLVYEAGLEYLADYIIVVDASLDVRIERLKRRNNYTKEQALLRINNQIPQEEKVKKADYVINNNGESLNVEEVINKLKGR